MYHEYSMEKILCDLKSPTKKNFILDTDTYNEIDDQFAIAYAMLADDVNLLALTAAPFFNCRVQTVAEGMEKSYEEMVLTRDLVDPEGCMNIPCYRGSDRYMPNTITPVYSEAAENIVRIVNEADGIVYVAMIGCYTNVASALLIDPSIADKMVVMMIGSNCFGYYTCNDYNLMQDRAAARVIFECGVPVMVLPAHGGAGTGRLLTTTAEVFYYLKGKSGKIGDYLCSLMEREGGSPDGDDGECFSQDRIIWDIASVATIRLRENVGNIQIMPAHTISPDGDEWRPLNDGREMIYIDMFRRNEIMSDFFTVIRKSVHE